MVFTEVADAIHFALIEGARFSQALSAGHFQILENGDAFWSLPKVDGQGDLICGRKAGNRLFQACASALQSSEYVGRIDEQALFGAFKADIFRRFITENRPISEEEARAAFQAALALSLARLEDLNHIIPCHLVIATEPDCVCLGPVTFWRREARWPDFLQALDRFYNRHSGRDRVFHQDIENYYLSFDWIADARVLGCESKPSRSIAERMVWSALDCLQLLIGGQRLERMEIGGLAAAKDQRCHLAFKSGEIANASVSVAGRGVLIGNDTWKELLTDENQNLLQLLGAALDGAYRLPKPTPLGERVIDAVHWFGLATRDRSVATKIVMFLMAVETLLLPTGSKAILSDVKRRARPFCTWDDHNSKVDDIYCIRGKIAHGQMTAKDLAVHDAAYQAGKLAEQVLIGALLVIGQNGLTLTDISPAELADAFDDIVKQYVTSQKQKASNVEQNGSPEIGI